MIRFKHLAAMFFAAIIFAISSPQSASAHASLISSDPADGVVLQTAPTSIILNFSEPVRPLVSRLTRPDSNTDVLGNVSQAGNTLTLSLPDALANGTYILSWRVASADGHPIGGGLIFSVGATSAINPEIAPHADNAVRTGLWTSRLGLMLGLLFGVGGIVTSVLLLREDQTGKSCHFFLFLGLISIPLVIGFQGLDALGEPVSSSMQMAVWEAGLFQTSFGAASLLACVAMLLAWAAMQQSRQAIRSVFAIAALLALGAATAGAGHAATAPPTYLTKPAVFIHAITATLWIGALLPLGYALHRRQTQALERFSSWIPIVVAILLVSGLVLSAVQVQTLDAMLTTQYGRVLSIKILLVIGLLILAAVNRIWFTHPALIGRSPAIGRLRKSIVAEVVLASMVIGVIGLWRFTPPPRVLAQMPPSIQEIVVSKDGLTGVLTISPPVKGPVSVQFRDLKFDGKALSPVSVTIELDKPSYGMGPFSRPAQKADDGNYRADGFVLPLDGFWVVHATVIVTDFKSVTITDIFEVR